MVKIKRKSRKDVKVLSLPGRDAWILVSKRSLGATGITFIEVHIRPGAYTSPVHAHTQCEEVIYVKEGIAEMWIEGNVDKVQEGEAVLVSADTKHAVRNAGTSPLKLLTAYPIPDHSKGFVEYDDCTIREWE